ncbi:MAG: DUF5916 domain-containing protein [Acidobacteriota bacterium]
MPRRRFPAAGPCLALAAILAPPLFAVETARLHVPTIAGAKLTLDGHLDEPVWQQAAEIPDLTQHEPYPGQSTPYRTRIRIFTDGENLYLGYDCFDPEPQKIVVRTLQRDGNIEGDDSVDFVLDTFGDGRTAYWFLVTAGGARADGLVSDASGGFPSLDWDGVWDAAARRTATGWSAEVVVPARTLHFKRGAEAWGFNIARQVARKQMILRWTAIPHDAGFFDMHRAGKLDGLGDMKQGLGLSFAPFATASTARQRPAASESTANGGADLAYSFTPELAGSATYRTDFAETEVDARQVNLTRFPLFLPEKRTFFVEGQNQFDFGYGLGQDFIPFFSRRIGLFAGGAVPIDYGLKLLGHAGRMSIGVLGARTRDSAGGPPASDFMAGRLAYDLDEHWRVGTIFTRGDPDGVNENSLGGGDAVYRTTRFRGDKNLVAAVWGARSSGDLRPGKRSGWGARLEYPNDLWSLYADLREFGDALDPALGFLPRPGTRWYQAGGAFQPRPRPDGRFGWARQFFYEAYGTVVTDLADRPQSWELFLAPFNVQTHSGDHHEVNVIPYFERLNEPFEIAPGVVIAPGAYHFTRYRVLAEGASSRIFRPSLAIQFGEFYDGHLTQWQPAVGWSSPGGHVRLDASAELDYGTLRAGSFVARLLALRALYAATPNLVLSSFTQYDSGSSSLGTNNLLRWTIAPGRDLYLVWNHSWNRTAGERFSLHPQAEQVSAKLRWTFWW